MNEKKYCAKCKREKYIENFRCIGYGTDRKTPRFHSYCIRCLRMLDRRRYADPEFAAVRKAKRKQRYEQTGR